MSTILTKRQREALESVSMEIGEFVVRSRLKRMGRLDIGTETLEFLVSLGLLEKGPAIKDHGEFGYKITDDGWRCMYGMTRDEITEYAPAFPLATWRWPPL
jgi:hypothetical protein